MVVGIVLASVGLLVLVLGIVGSIKSNDMVWVLAPVVGIALMFASTPALMQPYVESNSTVVSYKGTEYKKIETLGQYEEASSGDNLWVSNSFLEIIVSGEIKVSDDSIRVSGSNIAHPYGDGYLIPGGSDVAVYVDVVKDDSLRSIPILYEDGKFIFHQGDFGTIEFGK